MESLVNSNPAVSEKMDSNTIRTSSWNKMIPELLMYVCKYLGRGDFQQLRLLCTQWRDITDSEFIKKSKLIIDRYNMATLHYILQKDDEFSGRLTYDSIELNGLKTSHNLKFILKSLEPKIRKLCVKQYLVFDILHDCLPQLEELSIRGIESQHSKNLLLLDLSKFENFKSLDIMHCGVDPKILNDFMYNLTQQDTLNIEKLCIDVNPPLNIIAQFVKFRGKSLKHLEIDFCMYNGNISDWTKAFSMLTNLKNLIIRGLISEEFFSSIIDALPKKTPLRRFCLDRISSLTLNQLFSNKSFGLLSNLEMKACDSATNRDVKGMVIWPHILRNLIIKNLGEVPVEGLQCTASEKYNVLQTLVYAHLRSPYNNILNLRELAQHSPRLTYLNLEYCRGFLDDGVLSCIFRHQLHLQHLHLNYCSQITDKGLLGYGTNPAPISNLKGLQSLSLRFCHKITNFALIKGFKFIELRKLEISFASHINSKGIKEMVNNCPALEEIVFLRCSMMDDDSILYIAQGLPRLRRLNVDYCNRLTHKSLEYIVDLCNTLKELSMHGLSHVNKKGNCKELCKEKLASYGIDLS